MKCNIAPVPVSADDDSAKDSSGYPTAAINTWINLKPAGKLKVTADAFTT